MAKHALPVRLTAAHANNSSPRNTAEMGVAIMTRHALLAQVTAAHAKKRSQTVAHALQAHSAIQAAAKPVSAAPLDKRAATRILIAVQNKYALTQRFALLHSAGMAHAVTLRTVIYVPMTVFAARQNVALHT